MYFTSKLRFPRSQQPADSGERSPIRRAFDSLLLVTVVRRFIAAAATTFHPALSPSFAMSAAVFFIISGESAGRSEDTLLLPQPIRNLLMLSRTPFPDTLR